MSKFILCAVLVLTLLVSLAACGGEVPPEETGGTLRTEPSERESLPAETEKSTLPPETTVSTDPGETSAPTETGSPAPTGEDTQPAEVDSKNPETTNPPVSPTEPDNQVPSLDTLWDMLYGCWIGEDGHFAYFTYNDYGPAFWSGFWENPVPYRREAASVSGLNNLSSGLYTMHLTYPPITEDAADSQDLQEIHYTLMVDISELDQGHIYVEAPEDTMRAYTWGGYSYDDAFDKANAPQYATFDEMQEFWQWLQGYWNSDNGRFVCFEQQDSNTLLFMEGIWDAGTRGWGYYEKAMSGAMDLPTEFVVYWPPVSNELDGNLPAESVLVMVDWMEVETHGHIFVKLGKDGVWRRYHYAGASYEEAYPYD